MNLDSKPSFYKRYIRIPLRILLSIVLICGLTFFGILLYLTVVEFNPEASEPIAVTGNSSRTLKTGDSIKILSWNVGYGGLGAEADFFMDGGHDVTTYNKDGVEDNIFGISDIVSDLQPDIAVYQEVDLDSARSYHFNEAEELTKVFSNSQSSFANNFLVDFVPYPIPPIGKVSSGILTDSQFEISDSTRLSLPCPFGWPLRVGNLKRCLLVSRIPLANSDKELVIVNLHLEAYDSGEGKIAQTKQLLQVLQDEYKKGNYVIAAGDFNQTFSNVDLSNYPVYEGKWEAGKIETSDFGNDFTLAMDDTAPSCRSLDQVYAGADISTFQFYVIDGFICSKNVSIRSVETKDYDFQYSDHNPVVLEATLNP